jgi:cytochrome P450
MQNALGTHAGLHHRNRRPGTSSEERISGCRDLILRAQIKGRLLLPDAEKATLAEIAQRLGRKVLEELAAVAKPDTLLAWYRKLIANKFDGSRFRQRVGRPRIDEEAERLVVQMAKENPGWATIASWVPWQI